MDLWNNDVNVTRYVPFETDSKWLEGLQKTNHKEMKLYTHLLITCSVAISAGLLGRRIGLSEDKKGVQAEPKREIVSSFLPYYNTSENSIVVSARIFNPSVHETETHELCWKIGQRTYGYVVQTDGQDFFRKTESGKLEEVAFDGERPHERPIDNRRIQEQKRKAKN